MPREDVLEAARGIEALDVPSAISTKRMSRQERKEQAERVRRFLALPPELQEGVLRYAENMKEALEIQRTAAPTAAPPATAPQKQPLTLPSYP